MLASGADDGLVCVWDLFNSSNGAALDTPESMANNNGAPPGPAAAPGPSSASTPAAGAPQGNSTPAAGPEKQAQQTQMKGPAASWRCDYEVGNLSWAPTSGLTSQGGEWVGVSGGRGIWGVKL